MNAICVVAVGAVASEPLAWIEAAATEWYPFEVRRLAAMEIPPGSYDAARGQYRSVEILKALAGAAPREAVRLLGVTEGDLSIPMLTFLFGQAQLDGQLALVSLCRLRPEYYGLPPDGGLLRERVIKETLHELGHTFGLAHCDDRSCCMSLATHVQFVDAKGTGYCAACAAHLAGRFARLQGDGDEEHLAHPDCG